MSVAVVEHIEEACLPSAQTDAVLSGQIGSGEAGVRISPWQLTEAVSLVQGDAIAAIVLVMIIAAVMDDRFGARSKVWTAFIDPEYHQARTRHLPHQQSPLLSRTCSNASCHYHKPP